MKRILFASVSLWLFCSSLLLAQNQGLDFYLYSSERVRSIENNLQYRFFPFAHASLQITGRSSLEDRLSFNQGSKQALLNLGLNISQKNFQHSFSSDYQSVYDASDLEPSAYVNKTAMLGYQLSYLPLDSLSLSLFSRGVFRREQDRYISGEHLASKGYWLGSNARYASTWNLGSAGIGLVAERKKMAWEAFDLAQVSSNFSMYGQELNWDNNFNYSQRNEDIYILNIPGVSTDNSYYSLSDSQSRRLVSASSSLQYNPWQQVQLNLAEEYSQNHTNYSSSEIRNNADYLNQAKLNLNIELHKRLAWENELGHSYAIKDFNYNRNTRHTENRHLASKIAWEYSPADSLIASVSLDLQIIEFPDDLHRWDNDLLTANYRLGWKHYWHERIKLGAWLGYSEREDVYLDSLLSANNKYVRSYSFYPDCQILLGDRLLFRQAYQLRADYSDYMYDTGKDNSFYRQLGYKYNLIFDTFPYIARSGDNRWLNLPFRNSPDNAFQIDLGYAYEENQYADQNNNHYDLHTKYRRYTSTLSLRQDVRSFFWTLTPKYSWGTWKEYSLVLAWAWEFNNASLIEFTISPYGEDIAQIDWRSTVNLNLRF